MSEIPITTSQNVNIDFALASVGERIVASIIDNVIRYLYLLVLYYILFRIFHFENYVQSTDRFSLIATVIIITLPFSIYSLVLESLMEGQTFGKKIMKIRVVKIDGYQAGYVDYFVRWLARIIDFFGNIGVVALIASIISKNNQRLGDMVAGTAVISLKNDVNISHTILENLREDYVPRFPQVVALTDNDMRIIKENYQKALKNNDIPVIHKLSQKIQEILKMEFDNKEFTEKLFIDKIIKDYNFYTGKEN